MILIDARVGSKDLVRPLRTLGAPVDLTTLDYGDLACFGHGPQGNVDIGIERKVNSDLLNSIQSGRLMGHQIPGLVTAYDYRYLLVEGIWRAGAQGILEVPRKKPGKQRGIDWVAAGFGRRGWLYGDLVRFFTSVQVLAGVGILRTANRMETALTIHALHEWWDKPWAAHKSLKTIHAVVPPKLLLVKPSVTQTVAAQLPGVGWEFSGPVEEAFGSVRKMAAAERAEWADVRPAGVTKTGRKRGRFGVKRAERVVSALRGE